MFLDRLLAFIWFHEWRRFGFLCSNIIPNVCSVMSSQPSGRIRGNDFSGDLLGVAELFSGLESGAVRFALSSDFEFVIESKLC
jgi:hypothetical protein